jgi:hypothetical protein
LFHAFFVLFPLISLQCLRFFNPHKEHGSFCILGLAGPQDIFFTPVPNVSMVTAHASVVAAAVMLLKEAFLLLSTTRHDDLLYIFSFLHFFISFFIHYRLSTLLHIDFLIIFVPLLLYFFFIIL